VESRDLGGNFFPLERHAEELGDGTLEHALDRLVEDLLTHAGQELGDDMALLLAERRGRLRMTGHWWQASYAGRLEEQRLRFPQLLRDNVLGDPAERPLYVYVPPGYDDDPARRYPSIYLIQGYTGSAPMWWNRSAYRTPLPIAADAVFASGQAPPAIVVYVDAWTAYGGSQFVDSPGTGRYPLLSL